MNLKKLAITLAASLLTPSVYAVTTCAPEDAIVVKIITGYHSANPLDTGLTVEVIPAKDVNLPPPSTATPPKFIKAFLRNDLDDAMGKVLLAQLRAAMVSGFIVRLINGQGTCDVHGFTGVEIR